MPAGGCFAPCSGFQGSGVTPSIGAVELALVPGEPMKLGSFENTNVGFLLGKVLAMVQTWLLGSWATMLRHRECLVG